MKKRLLKAIIFIFAIIVCVLTARKVYNNYKLGNLENKCNSIVLVNDEDDYGVHPFVYNNGLVAVIPASWCVDSLAVFYQGCLQVVSVSDNHIIHFDGEDIVVYQSKIASVQINTLSGSMDEINASLDKSVSESGTIRVINKDLCIEYDGSLKKIKGRGNGTWRQNQKKPYNITLAHSVEMLGLNKAKKFCLLANDKDNTHLKNWIAYKIAKDLGSEYPVDCEHAAVWFNGRYAGLYLVTNKIDIAESSVNIRDLEEATELENGQKLNHYSLFNTGDDYTDSWNCFPKVGGTKKGIDGADDPDDITGGYLLDHSARLFTYAGAESGFVTENKWSIIIKSPEYATRKQVDYISNKYNAMEKAISSEDGYGPDGIYYTDYIDMHSFVTYYLCQEVLMNHDGGIGSVTIFKPEDSISPKFFAGPVWDFDVAFSSGTSDIGRIPQSYVIRDGLKCPNGYIGILGEVAKHKDFIDSVRSCYITQMRPIVEKHLFSHILDIKREELTDDVKYNAMAWGKVFDVFFNGCEELVKFMHERIEFFDAEWITNQYNHSIILDVEWSNNPLPYHIISLRVKDGEKISNFPIHVNSYYYDYNTYKGIGWFVSGTDTEFNPSASITEDVSLEYRWERRGDFELWLNNVLSSLRSFVSALI